MVVERIHLQVANGVGIEVASVDPYEIFRLVEASTNGTIASHGTTLDEMNLCNA